MDEDADNAQDDDDDVFEHPAPRRRVLTGEQPPMASGRAAAPSSSGAVARAPSASSRNFVAHPYTHGEMPPPPVDDAPPPPPRAYTSGVPGDGGRANGIAAAAASGSPAEHAPPTSRPASIPADMSAWVFQNLDAAAEAIAAYELARGGKRVSRRSKPGEARGLKGTLAIYMCDDGCSQDNVEWRVAVPNKQSNTVWLKSCKRNHACGSAAAAAAATSASPALAGAPLPEST